MSSTGRKYTQEQITNAVINSKSLNGVLKYLGMANSGASRKQLTKYIGEYGLTTNHFVNINHLPPASKRPLIDYLTNKAPINSHRLRLRLIKERVLEAKCYKCDNTGWLGQPISLELEHINGNHLDNTLANLTILCPNCHAQTETYRGKNKPDSKKPKWVKPALKVVYCIDCNKKIDNKSTRCKSCQGKTQDTKINWPTIEQLELMLVESNYTKLGQLLGVSDNAIRQHIKRHKK